MTLRLTSCLTPHARGLAPQITSSSLPPSVQWEASQEFGGDREREAGHHRFSHPCRPTKAPGVHTTWWALSSPAGPLGVISSSTPCLRETIVQLYIFSNLYYMIHLSFNMYPINLKIISTVPGLPSSPATPPSLWTLREDRRGHQDIPQHLGPRGVHPPTCPSPPPEHCLESPPECQEACNGCASSRSDAHLKPWLWAGHPVHRPCPTQKSHRGDHSEGISHRGHRVCTRGSVFGEGGSSDKPVCRKTSLSEALRPPSEGSEEKTQLRGKLL